MVTIDKQTGTASLEQYGNPKLLHSMRLENGAVMQDLVLTPNNRYFISQAINGSNGTREPYENTKITRINPLTQNQDSMILVDCGHGIGVEVQYVKSVPYIIMSWSAPSPESQGRWYDLVRFQYKPREKPYTRGEVEKLCGLKLLPIQWPELLVHFDWRKNWVVAKHFDGSIMSDIYTRRKIDEFMSGTDRKYGEIVAPISKGTLQGFTTINNTLYRWMGLGTLDNIRHPEDPFALQSFNWETGQEISYKTYQNLGTNTKKQWPGGKGEPEGLCVYREKSGKASLIAGLVVGFGKDRRWQTYKFANIGAA